MYYELTVAFKSGGKTKSVFSKGSDLLRYIDETIRDDDLYDSVSDWLYSATIGSEDFQMYPLTICVCES